MSNKYLQNQSYEEFQKLINYIISENNNTPSDFNNLFARLFMNNSMNTPFLNTQKITSKISSLGSVLNSRNYSMGKTGKMKYVNPQSKFIKEFYNFIEEVYKNFNNWVGLKNSFLILFCEKYRNYSQNIPYLAEYLPLWDDINQSRIAVVNTFDRNFLSIISGSNDQHRLISTIEQNSQNIGYQNLTIQKEIPSVVSNCSNIFSNKQKRCRDYQYNYGGQWYVCRNQTTGSVCGNKSSSSGLFTSSNSLTGRIKSTKQPLQSQYQPLPPQSQYQPPPPQSQYQPPPPQYQPPPPQSQYQPPPPESQYQYPPPPQYQSLPPQSQYRPPLSQYHNPPPSAPPLKGEGGKISYIKNKKESRRQKSRKKITKRNKSKKNRSKKNKTLSNI